METMTKPWLSQEEIDDRIRDRVSVQLSKDIAAYDGSPIAAKEILRGLAAARMMGIDLGRSKTLSPNVTAPSMRLRVFGRASPSAGECIAR